MSNEDDMILFMKKRIGEWCCSVCSSNSNQSAATFRGLKNKGYHFEEASKQRWGKRMFCPICNKKRTHYKLLSLEPVFDVKKRNGFTDKIHKHILDVLHKKDAFTGATISSVAEVDHKIPWTRLNEDIDSSNLNDEEIVANFQLLTRDHNLLKDRMCSKCKSTNIRPPFFEIPFWYKGDEHYCGSCEGCGWYDGVAWRISISKLIKRNGWSKGEN